MPDQQTVTAWHEAGHALVAHLCGRLVTAVSANPRQHFAGATLLEADAPTGLPPYGIPMILKPADYRRGVEVMTTILLAGRAAEQVYLEHRTRTALAQAATLTPTRPVAVRTPDTDTDLQHRLEAADRPDLVDDLDAAWRKVRTLTGAEPLAAAVVRMCEQQALTLLRQRLPVLQQIADALGHRDLTGTDLLDIIEGAHDATHPQA